MRPHLAKDEIRYHGIHSCLSIWKNRPQDIIRIYFRSELEGILSEVITYCKKNKKSFHIVKDTDLEKLTDSKNHQGVCFVSKEKKILNESDFFRTKLSKRCLILYLDNVSNPHNLGAIIRSACHFNILFICMPSGSISRISPAAHRTSEGGAEYISLIRVNDLEKFLFELKKSFFQSYALDISTSSNSLYQTRLNDRTIFLLGSEVSGLSPKTKALVDSILHIPGSGNMESLNVSVAAAIAMGEFQRQGIEKTVRIIKSPID